MNEIEYVWSKLKYLSKTTQYPKKTTLLLAGDVCDKIYLNEKLGGHLAINE